MTREEEIYKAAEEFAFSHKTETSDFHDAINDFYYGAKWADENQPGMAKMRKDYEFLFMLKKKELIEKACELLKNTIDDDVLVKCGSVIKCMDVDEFVVYFCKAMEE